MRLNWKKLLLSLFIGVGMTMIPACNNSVDYTPDGGEPGKEVIEPTETGYLSVRLSLGSTVGTKVDQGTESGRFEEQKVQSVWLILYGVSNNKVEYFFNLDASNGSTVHDPFSGNDVSQESINTASSFVTVGIPIVKQRYRMLVLVNAQAPDLFKVGEPISNVVDAVQKISDRSVLTDNGGLAQDNSFFMSNAQGLINISEMDIMDSEKKAERNPKLVSVERAVAKIILDYVPTPSNDDKFINIKWDVDVTNLRTYWLRKMTNLYGGIPEQTNDGSDRYHRYAEDPNFSGYSQWNNSGVNLDNEFEYLPSDAYPYLAQDYSLVSSDSYIYVLENTMAADEQRQDVTTRLVVGGYYIPKALNSQTPKNFYTYKGNVITESTMDFYSLYPNIAESEHPGLAKAMTEAKIIYGPNIFDYGDSTKEPFSQFGINYYKNGLCYYTVLIRHFDDDIEPNRMAYGRYGVVRNNVYRFNLKTIPGPGSPKLYKPGPEPDDDETSISAYIEVLPWQVHDQMLEFN